MMGHTFMGVETHGTRPSERLAVYLRSQYRRDHRTKRLSADLDCTPKAAENILGGHWPSDLHFAAIVRRFGRDVLDAVFGSEIDATIARLTEEARTLEQQLSDVRSRARQAQGFDPQLELFPAAASASLDDAK
jgi:hypothetical protein